MSEQSDYLLPTNFKRLEADFDEETKSVASRPAPRLVEVDNFEYPGSAVLGDARALGMFVMQREVLAAGDELEGWVMFHSPDTYAEKIRVEIDLGQGLIPIEFMLPRDR